MPENVDMCVEEHNLEEDYEEILEQADVIDRIARIQHAKGMLNDAKARLEVANRNLKASQMAGSAAQEAGYFDPAPKARELFAAMDAMANFKIAPMQGLRIAPRPARAPNTRLMLSMMEAHGVTKKAATPEDEGYWQSKKG
jgi:hypothetical protein